MKTDFLIMTHEEFIEMCSEIKMEIEKELK